MAVVDASIWVAAFHEKDKFNKIAFGFLENLVALGDPIRVPAIVYAEVAGAIRRRTKNLHITNKVLAKMHALDLDIREIDTDFARSAADIAAHLEMRGADSFYVALAKEFGEALYTFDDEQAKRGSVEVETVVPL